MPSQPNEQNPFADAPVVYRYSRAQAIDDGVLIDLSPWASETGFRFPVACSQAVWAGHIEPPVASLPIGQSSRGRAHDVLWMLYLAIQRSAPHTSEVRFEVLLLNGQLEQETVALKALCGPGDAGEPVLTILMIDED